MDIMSRLYKVEICVLHIEECNMVPVNSCQATKRIFLLYDGIHYDAVVFKGFGVEEVRQVAVDDGTAWELAMQMTTVIQASGGYTNDRTMMMKCDVCGKIVKGKKEANAHGKVTGHAKFSQAKM
jgi:ubiquitin thioesterase OTU1